MSRISQISQRAHSKLYRSRHRAALERPELRMETSPRQSANPGGTMAVKVQRTPEVEAALRKYAQEQLIKDARLARALAQQGIKLIEEGIARSRASR
jgi:hypothetical protein